MQPKAQPDNSRLIRQALQAVDVGRTGYLDKAEFVGAMSTLQAPTIVDSVHAGRHGAKGLGWAWYVRAAQPVFACPAATTSSSSLFSFASSHPTYLEFCRAFFSLVDVHNDGEVTVSEMFDVMSSVRCCAHVVSFCLSLTSCCGVVADDGSRFVRTSLESVAQTHTCHCAHHLVALRRRRAEGVPSLETQVPGAAAACSAGE